MAKTESEKREYQRGYNRAMQRCRERASSALKIARGYRSKAAVAIYHDTQPSCVSCERWTRGGPECVWGYCRADFNHEAGEKGMWADRVVGETDQRKIVTQEQFGCVNWLSRDDNIRQIR